MIKYRKKKSLFIVSLLFFSSFILFAGSGSCNGYDIDLKDTVLMNTYFDGISDSVSVNIIDYQSDDYFFIIGGF